MLLNLECGYEKMDSISNNKPFIYEQKQKKDPTRILTAIAGTGIPVIHSLANGMTANGNAAVKTTVALGTAKGWGLFIAGSMLFNKVATSIINNVKPLKDFSENHPGLTSIGIIIGGIKAGSATVHYGNKAITNLLGNKPFEEKVNEILQKSSILKNKTIGNISTGLGNFAKSSTGKFLGKTALIGAGLLFFKSIFDLGKIEHKIAKAKES